MKKSILLLAWFLFFSIIASAQADYKVVFDLTSKDSNDHKSLIRWLNAISKAEPSSKLEVVMYGQGLDLVLKGKSIVADEVTKLAAGKNVSFRVCAAAMKNHNIDASQLLPGVGIVPDGIYEIMTRQREGWGYIKVKN